MIKTIKDIELKEKRVIMRVDFNVPMKDGKVQDGQRIISSIPTINYLLEHGVKSIVLMSHLGDPEKDIKKAEEKATKEGKSFDRESHIKAKHNLKPIAVYLGELLKKEIKFAPSCIGQLDLVNSLNNGEVLMLENTRLEKGEKAKDEKERESLAKELAKYGDLFINDAFGSAHREHASTSTIAKFIPESVGGLLMEKEIIHLEPILKNPEKPFTAIIGGAKVSSKISVLQNLLSKASTLIIGGGMAYTFLKAMGHSIGSSIFEQEYLNVASSLLEKAKELNVKVILPIDHLCAEKFSEEAISIPIENIDIPNNMIAMDVGNKTLLEYKNAVMSSKTIMWNGPVGVFEFANFAHGTEYLAKAIAEATEKGATSVVGGGDSIAALNKFNLANKMTHVSTGGGASLEYLEGKNLPGITCLQTK